MSTHQYHELAPKWRSSVTVSFSSLISSKTWAFFVDMCLPVQFNLTGMFCVDKDEQIKQFEDFPWNQRSHMVRWKFTEIMLQKERFWPTCLSFQGLILLKCSSMSFLFSSSSCLSLYLAGPVFCWLGVSSYRILHEMRPRRHCKIKNWSIQGKKNLQKRSNEISVLFVTGTTIVFSSLPELCTHFYRCVKFF